MPIDPNSPIIFQELDPNIFLGRASDVSLKLDPASSTPISAGTSGLSVGLPNSELIPDFWRDLSGKRANENSDTTEQITHEGRAIVGASTPAVPSILEVTAPIGGDPAIGATGKIQFASYGKASLEGADLGKAFSGYVAGFANDGTLIEVPSSGGGVTSGQVWSYVGTSTGDPILSFGNFQIQLSGAARIVRLRAIAGTETLEVYRTNIYAGGAVEAQNFNNLALTTAWTSLDILTLTGGDDRIALTITPSSATDGRWYDALLWTPSPTKVCMHVRSLVA
jgi:hypothetical protein